MTTPKKERAVLPPRSKLALQLCADGFSRAEAAGLMSISLAGVSSALATARRKLDAARNEQAVATALRRGLIT